MSDDRSDAGLAAMLDELVRRNLQRDPARHELLVRPLTAVIEVPDAGVRATIRVAGGRVSVRSGDDPRARLRVRADGERVLGLASVPLWRGLPDVRSPDGRGVLRDLLTGAIRVDGLLSRLADVRRLTALLSAR